MDSFLISAVTSSFETETARESGALKSGLSAEFLMDSCKTLLYQEFNKFRTKKIYKDASKELLYKKISFSLFKAIPAEWSLTQSHHPMNIPYRAY